MSIWLYMQRQHCHACADGIPFATSWTTTERPHVLPGYGRQAVPLPCTMLLALRRKLKLADRLLLAFELLDEGDAFGPGRVKYVENAIECVTGGHGLVLDYFLRDLGYPPRANVCLACGNIAGPYWCSHCGAT